MDDTDEKYGGFTYDQLRVAWERISPGLRGAHWKDIIDCPVTLLEGETLEGLEDLLCSASEFMTTQPVWLILDGKTGKPVRASGPGYWNGPESLQ